jgi:hypothetical protein
MNKYNFSIFVLAGIFLALLMTAAMPQTAQAKICGYNAQKTPIPCPPTDKPKPTSTDFVTKTPTYAPKPTDTPVPADSATPAACVPASGGTNGSSQPPAGANGGLLFSPWLLSGGGLLGGILIGMILGGVIGPMMNRGRKAGGEGQLLPAVDTFAKDQDTGFSGGNAFQKPDDGSSWAKADKAAKADAKFTGGVRPNDASEAGMIEWRGADGPVDMFAKQGGGAGNAFQKPDDGSSWAKADKAAKADDKFTGGVRPGQTLDAKFQKDEFDNSGQASVTGDGITGTQFAKGSQFAKNQFAKGDANLSGGGDSAAGPGAGPHTDSNLGDGSV